jgi:hypothetical protein
LVFAGASFDSDGVDSWVVADSCAGGGGPG